MVHLRSEKILNETIEIVRRAGTFISAEAGNLRSSDVELKGFNDLVSYVDRSAEKMLVSDLTPLIDGADFILEEKTSEHDTGSEFKWIIDPLDGTTNFVHGIPCYCISVALLKGDDIMLGVVFELNRSELFSAFRGKGAFLNDVKVQVSETGTLSGSLVATGFPYHDFSRATEYMKVFDHCMRNTRGLRRLGSAAVDLAYTACGRFDMFYEYGLNAWDVAAGILLVEEAGGTVTDFKGGNDPVFGREIIASNGKVHSETLAVVKDKFGQS